MAQKARSPKKSAAAAAPNGKGQAATEVSAEVSVDVLLAQVPALENVAISPVFKEFLEKLAPRLTLGDTSLRVLQALSAVDVKAEHLADLLRANPYYGYHLLHVVRSLKKSDDEPSLEAALILLGIQNSRNYLLAIGLSRMTGRGHPEWGSDGKIALKPAEALKYALKAEDAFAGLKDGDAESAFAAGLVFDALSILGQELGADKKKIAAFIDGSFTQALKSARLAASLARQIPGFPDRRCAVPAALLQASGRIALAILLPDYLPFLEACGKGGLPDAVERYAERVRFGVSAQWLGAVICHRFRVFQDLEQVVLHGPTPFMLQSRDSRSYALACLAKLASNMAGEFRKVDKEDDPLLRRWKSVELKDFAVDAKAMIAAAASSG